MDNCSRGSNVSLTESEPSVVYSNRTTCERSVCIPNQKKDHIGNSYTHTYNTRSAARRITHESPLKDLIVDLSDSKVNPYLRQQNFELALLSQTKNLERRRSSSYSEDSTIFDTEHSSYSKSLKFNYKIMNEINPCDPGRRNSGGYWLKYFILISITSILYLYIQSLHSSDAIKKMNKELHTFMDETKNKLYKIEKTLSHIKHKQDKQHYGLKNAISQEIEKYSSDKTGKTDFALEATGGRIVQLSPGTENFEKAVTFFGVTLCDGKHGPRAMIQADMSPGNCWAIKGNSGGVVIKLLGPVKIDSFSLEHISKNLSPTGEVSSAPNSFSVWGLSHLNDRGQPLGTFSYNLKGPLVQTFSISNSNTFEYVEFKVITNQGHPDFTCIYRFRVHGQLIKDENKT